MGGRSKLDWSCCSDVWFFFPGCNGDINKLEENKQIRSLVCLERSRLNLKSCSRFPVVCPTGISRFANSSWMWNTNCLICSSNWDEVKILMCLKGTSKHFVTPCAKLSETMIEILLTAGLRTPVVWDRKNRGILELASSRIHICTLSQTYGLKFNLMFSYQILI